MIAGLKRTRPSGLHLAAGALLIALLLMAAVVSAEPRFALRQGVACSHCHVNRTGGGMRTAYGNAFAQTGLGTWDAFGIVNPRAGDSIAVGANVRLSNRTTRKAAKKLADKTFEIAASNSFEMPEGNLYVNIALIPERLDVYIDETIGPEAATNREAFVMLGGGPADSYVKAGRFLLPFGLRLPDDRAFIRQETGFNYTNQDLGVELGLAPHPFHFALAVTNGSLGGADINFAKQLSAHAAVIGTWLRGGLSAAWNDTSTPDLAFSSLTFGGHLGARLGRLMLLGEFDWIHGSNDTESHDQWALYTGADFEAIKGLYLRATFEGFDPSRTQTNNARDRFVFGLSWFPLPMCEIRAEYRLNRDIPQRIEGNADEIIVELHGFL
jgi:hypothetical protein